MLEDVKWFPHPQCRKPHALWSAPDKDATEYEVTAFIAALVRLTKPSVVVETGTYEGHTTAAICDALEANGVGRLVTFETDLARAVQVGINLSDHVDTGSLTIWAEAVTPQRVPSGVEFAFLDSGMRTRADDMAVVWPRVTAGGLVLVHDASPDRPPGKVRPPGAHQAFDFATPRGLLAFQKPWS